MTQLTEKDIENLANLSKLEMTKDEAQKYLKDINGILGYVSQIEKVEIADSDIGNTANYNFHTMLRDDVAQDGNTQVENQKAKDIIMQNVPNKSSDNYVKVVKVLNK
jgi:aspartyl/glutamyl-tRNA(Asn/Gln) amidotransferase C subunit